MWRSVAPARIRPRLKQRTDHLAGVVQSWADERLGWSCGQSDGLGDFIWEICR